jgi:hypothetical protein
MVPNFPIKEELDDVEACAVYCLGCPLIAGPIGTLQRSQRDGRNLKYS